MLDNVPFVREASAKRLATDAVRVLKQCLRHGTTTIEARSGYGLNLSTELKILRVLTLLGDAPITVVPTVCAAAVLPPEYTGKAPEYIDWASRELLPSVHKRGLARFIDVVCDRGAFSADELRPLLAASAVLEMPLKLSLAAYGPADGAVLLREFPFASADHLDYLDEPGITHMAETGTMAVLAPAFSFFLGRQFAPARALIDRGVPVALASNYSRVTSPTCNMQTAIFIACHELRIKPAEAITAATLNAAWALKLGHRIGSLEAGKQADLIILNVDDYRELGHEFGVNLVDMTMKQGVVVSDRTGVKWPAHS
jgi:imidazolonepropionase